MADQDQRQGFSSSHQFDHRINRQDLFACLAIWMEQSPLATTRKFLEEMSVKDLSRSRKRRIDGDDVIERKKLNTTQHCPTTDTCIPESDSLIEEQKINKVGVVLVDQENRIVALDCSREGLHGVVNVLVMQSQKVRGCDVYVSRKPCCLCTKYMVQMNINRVYYLPFEPEIPTLENINQSEQMYRVSSIAQSVYIPTINKATLDDTTLRRSPYTHSKACHKEFTKVLLDLYWNDDWIAKIPEMLHWPGFVEASEKVHQNIFNMFSGCELS